MRELFTPEVLERQDDPMVWLEVLNRAHQRIAEAFLLVHDFQPETADVKLQDGLLRYFDAAVYDPGLGSGLYLYQGGRWNLVQLTPVGP